MARNRTSLEEFTTVRSEGTMLPADILRRIAREDVEGMKPQDYDLPSGLKLNEAITQAWTRALAHWEDFKEVRAAIPAHDETGGQPTRQKWLMPLLEILGFGKVPRTKSQEIDGRPYPIQFFWDKVPLHLLGCKLPIDKRTKGVAGAATNSPHSLVQEFLNRSEEHLWAILTNGLQLRVLRDNASLSRQAFVEFDLEAMMDGEVYSDFALLWLICHVTRFEGKTPEACQLERWSNLAAEDGTRILEDLRFGVATAIERLGRGALGNPANDALRDALRSGDLDKQELYREILRVVYRLLFLFVAEDRDLLFAPESDETARARYRRFYSTTRLRTMADRTRGTVHSDLWDGLTLVFGKLATTTGCPELALPGLGSFLWDPASTPHLNGAHQTAQLNADDPDVPKTACTALIDNEHLLGAIRALAFAEIGKMRRVIDYKHLGAEELGSVYESLLELTPDIVAGDTADSSRFDLRTVSGNERKLSGSYYTPDSLVQCLLDSALEPVVADRLAAAKTQDEREASLLALTVCDPAVGSGHFVIAAAHRIARHLARVRTGDHEPSPDDHQHALRDVISRCIYGVDLNPMAAELCKVALWMESMEPGRPLGFLDHHILVGNSLIGTTPALLSGGLPSDAFKAIEGDDKKSCSTLKKQNTQELKDRRSGQDLFAFGGSSEDELASTAQTIEALDDDTLDAVETKSRKFSALRTDPLWQRRKLASDAWCAAFMWRKDGSPLGLLCPTDADIQRILTEDDYASRNSEQVAEINRLARKYKSFHWHLEFPSVMAWQDEDDGFDVMLGNPPWERVKLQEKEWFATRQEEIAEASSAAKRKKLIAKLEAEDPQLFESFLDARRTAEGNSHFLRDSARYPLCGRGDVNTYSIFTELNRNVTNQDGRASCIVPTGIATDSTTQYFFRDLVETHSLACLYGFENEAKLFPGVDHRVNFAILVMAGRGACDAADFSAFIREPTLLHGEERRYKLSSDDISLVNPNTRTCPIFRTRRDAEITKGIYRRVPVLIDESKGEDGNPWGITFNRMFDMANDSHLFHTRHELESIGWKLKGNIFELDLEQMLPLYEGKMVYHHNHRYGDFGLVPPGERAHILPNAEANKLADPMYSPHPRYWIDETEVRSRKNKLWKHSWNLGWRDVTDPRSSIRTVIPAIIPETAVSGKFPLIYVDAAQPWNIAANLSAFICDYIGRQKIGGVSLSIFIMKQLAIHPPNTYEQCSLITSISWGSWILPRMLELSYTSCDLKCFSGAYDYHGPPYHWNLRRRFQIRCELDAAFFHLYGIERDDVDYIMDTFPIVKRKDVKTYGTYRTKERILEIYDEMAQCMADGTEWQSPLDPPPGDPRAAWTEEELELWRRGEGDHLIEQYKLLEEDVPAAAPENQVEFEAGEPSA